MTERTRAHLRQEFQDGERPSGADFADVFDSCLSKQDDGISVDAGDGTLVLNRGLRLGDSAETATGTLRFNGTDVQVHDGAGFVDIGSGAGGGGAFQTLASNDVAYTGGSNVGIGASFAGADPTYRFEVDLGQNTGTDEQARFGQATIFRGVGAQSPAAHFAHRDHASNQGFALRQRPTGEVNFNTPLNVPMFFSQGGSAANTRMTVASGGQVLVGTANTLNGTAVFHVGGRAVKSDGGQNWDTASDARLKEDVAEYTTGLSALRKVRPVSFSYNGKAGTIKGARGIGVIAQEMETAMPETISVDHSDATGLDDLRFYNGSPVVFALVNAVQELANRVEELEHKLRLTDPSHTEDARTQ